MKINESTALSTPKLLLLPYSRHHVPTYHTWMQSPELQALTASEPPTLPEEYAMQRTWRVDADKLTFIVCLPLPPSSELGGDAELVTGGDETMIGDINLFLSQPDDDDDGDHEAERKGGVVGELELMIAVPSLQRQGFGRAALLTFLSYLLSHWGAIALEYAAGAGPLQYLRVRINQTNERSIALFESLGFVKTSETANYFGELELRWPVTTSSLGELEGKKGWESVTELRYLEPRGHASGVAE